MELTTRYLGLELEHPIVAGASPLSSRIDDILRMEDAGAAAVVMHSLFEEQLRQEALAMERITEAVEDNYAEALSYFPPIDGYKASSERYLETLREARERTGIPIIGSLNGITPQGWVEHAGQMEAAGAREIITTDLLRPAGWHLLGTARMGDDPDKSVVNAWGRSHDVKNLFIVDGSIFVTSAGVNPTRTIQALALYIADAMKQRLANLFD